MTMRSVLFLALCLACLSGVADELVSKAGVVSGKATYANGGVRIAGKSIALKDVLELRFMKKLPAKYQQIRWELITLRSGEVLAGAIPTKAGRMATVNTEFGAELEVKMADLYSIDYRDPKTAPALKKAKTTQVVLSNGRVEEGEVLYFTPLLVGLKAGTQRSRLSKRGLARIVFPGDRSRPAGEVCVRTAWGDQLYGKLTALNDAGLVIDSLLGKFTIARQHLFSITVLNGEEQLSSLPVSDKDLVPFIDRIRSPRFDQDLFGNPLRLGAMRFDSGISMQSLSGLNYKLKGQYSHLIGAVVLDTRYSTIGNAEAIILVDDRERKRMRLKHGDAPAHFCVDLAGGKELSLVLDFGELGSSGDYAMWLDPRLVRK